MNTRGKKKTSERAIIFAAALGGLSREQANEMLKEVGYPEVPESSWEMVIRAYVPKFEKTPTILGFSILSPKPVGDL